MSALVTAMGGSDPAVVNRLISQYEMSNHLCDRLKYSYPLSTEHPDLPRMVYFWSGWAQPRADRAGGMVMMVHSQAG